ncbi:hypothetical protein MMC07_001411 [Pseudocyphellaria aurata]|nr:hypothetical protein [Pseudocyphellaria aurata]
MSDPSWPSGAKVLSSIDHPAREDHTNDPFITSAQKLVPTLLSTFLSDFLAGLWSPLNGRDSVRTKEVGSHNGSNVSLCLVIEDYDEAGQSTGVEEHVEMESDPA